MLRKVGKNQKNKLMTQMLLSFMMVNPVQMEVVAVVVVVAVLHNKPLFP